MFLYYKKYFQSCYYHIATLSFEINYYIDKNKENEFLLIDKIFGLEKYKTYNQIIRELLTNEATNTNVNNQF